MVTILNLQLIF